LFSEAPVQELLPNTVKSARQAASISNEMCHNADESWERRRESQADSELTKIKPFYLALLCAKAKKSRINTQNSSRKALIHDEKEKSSSPSTASDKIGPVKKEANCAFCVDQSHLSFQVAEISAQRSMVETTPQLSSNSSFSLETPAIGEKEK